MSQTVRVQTDLDDVGFREVALEDAKRLIAELVPQGYIVIDKKTGQVIKEITPEIREIIIVQLMDGG
jgi:hypothetical protein